MRLCTIAAILAALLMTGCGLTGLYGHDEFQHYAQRLDSITASAGDAKEVNRVTHTDHPWQPYVLNRRIPVDGQRMTNAIRKYRSGPAAAGVQVPNGAAAESATQLPAAPSPAAVQ